jgi:predicted fused transcriptional regulator/phosphomethylpyrimidine kinase
LTGISAEGEDLAKSVAVAIEKKGFVPDVIFHENGKRNSIVILGKNPKDILEKINSVL